MGLDIYLYRCEDRPAAKALEAQFEARTEGLWEKHCDPHGTWKELSKEEQDRRYDIYKAEKVKIAVDMGLDDDGEHPGVKKIEKPSKKYPDHLFKIGYLRSSYNGSGFDAVMDRLGLPKLRDIMGQPKDEYEFTPDWAASRQRAVEALDRLGKIQGGDIDIMCVEGNVFAPDRIIKSEKEAREAVLKTLGGEHGFDSFENGYGHFFIKEPLEVIALLPGKTESFTRTLYGHDMPCTYVAYRKKQSVQDSYKASLEIVIETCDYVLAKKDPQNYYLHWSG